MTMDGSKTGASLHAENVARAVAYIASGEISPGEERLGCEFEHLILNARAETVSYAMPGGAQEILEHLASEGWSPVDEGGHILMDVRDGNSVSVEPGGQLEFSAAPCTTTEEVRQRLQSFYEAVSPVLEKHGNGLCALGFQPVTPIEEIEILPKERYYAMRDYFKSHGELSHAMMKGTASVQVSLDYTGEADYRQKYGLAARVSNVFYALMDNAPFAGAKAAEGYAYRARVWEHTDPARTGVFPEVFRPNFGYETYARWLLSRTAIFRKTPQGFERFEGTIDEAMLGADDAAMEHLFTMVFPDIRTKRFMEIRMIDALPYPENLAAIALIRAMFYRPANLDRLWNLFGDLTYAEHVRAKHELYERGPGAKMMGRSFAHWGMDLYDALELCEREREEIAPLLPMLEGNTLRRRQWEVWKKGYPIADVVREFACVAPEEAR